MLYLLNYEQGIFRQIFISVLIKLIEKIRYKRRIEPDHFLSIPNYLLNNFKQSYSRDYYFVEGRLAKGCQSFVLLEFIRYRIDY